MAILPSIHYPDLDVIAFEIKCEREFKRSQEAERFSKQYQEKPSNVSDNQDEIEETSLKSEIQPEPRFNLELYSAGFFDGLTGLNAELPHFKDYWHGYQLGYREYCCGLLKLNIPKSETESYPWQILVVA